MTDLASRCSPQTTASGSCASQPHPRAGTLPAPERTAARWQPAEALQARLASGLQRSDPFMDQSRPRRSTNGAPRRRLLALILGALVSLGATAQAQPAPRVIATTLPASSAAAPPQSSTDGAPVPLPVRYLDLPADPASAMRPVTVWYGWQILLGSRDAQGPRFMPLVALDQHGGTLGLGGTW